ncbi:Trihelix transcription factor GT-4, partial [Frankliniella fusca]
FSSPHQAAAFDELKHFEYIYSKLNLELVQSSGENKVPKNVAVPDMSAVIVKQIPPKKYKTETLIRNAIMCEGSSLASVVSKVLPYNEETQSVVLEFSSPHQAAAFAELRQLEYIYSKINLELMNYSDAANYQSQYDAPEPSACLVKHIPKALYDTVRMNSCVAKSLVFSHHVNLVFQFQDIFKHFLEETLVRNSLMLTGGDLSELVANISPYDCERESVILEFCNSDVAQIFTSLTNLTYIYAKLDLKLVHVPLAKGKCSTPVVDQVDSHKIEEVDDCFGDVEDPNNITNNSIFSAKTPEKQEEKDKEWNPSDLEESEAGTSGDEDSSLVQEDELHSLSSEFGINAFLHECSALSDDGTFRGTLAAFRKISDRLVSQHNVNAEVAKCKRLWKKLGNTYRTEIKNPKNSVWKLRHKMAALKGEPGIFPPSHNQADRVKQETILKSKRVIKSTKRYSPSEANAAGGSGDFKPSKELMPFRRNQKWHDEPTRRLIGLRVQMQSKFDAGHHQKQWEKIEKMMENEGFNFSAKQCEDKWDRLVDKYKKHRDNPLNTGASPSNFDYYDLLHDHMGKWPNVKPKVTFAFGSSDVQYDESD